MKFFFKSYKGELLVILLFLIFAGGFNIYRVIGDGRLYYAVTEKTLNIPDPESSQRCLDFGFQQCGVSFFNIPFYLIGYAIEKALPEKFDVNGITLRTIFINFASNFYLILSIVLIFRVLKDFGFKYKTVSVFSVLFSTSAFVTAVVTASLNHAVDVFIVSLFVFLAVKCFEGADNVPFWVGVTYVIAMTVRYQNIVLLIPYIIALFLNKRYKIAGNVLLGFFATVWILPLLFYFYNGSILNPSYSATTTQAAVVAVKQVVAIGFPKHMLKLLVHPIHGLFVWSPVTILSAFGLVLMTDKKKALAYAFLGIWFLLIVFYGFSADWHAGWSFSNRYMTGLFPIYTIGLCFFLNRYGRKGVVLAVIGTCYSLFLFFNWLTCIFHGQWETPIDMVRIWMNGKNPDVYYWDEINLKTFVKQIWKTCRYKHIFRVLI